MFHVNNKTDEATSTAVMNHKLGMKCHNDDSDVHVIVSHLQKVASVIILTVPEFQKNNYSCIQSIITRTRHIYGFIKCNMIN